MKTSMFCKGCWDQRHMLVPIRGPLAVPFKVMGINISRMNPNLCTVCETRFSQVKKARQIVAPVAILFADVRGYTDFSQLLDSSQVAHLLSHWYDQCAPVIWERDGIINKLIGDAILAVFNFPIPRKDYIRQAVLSGIELQRKCKEVSGLIEKGGAETGVRFSVGIGISAGNVSIGEIGQVCRDFTVVGPIVNLASRLQGAANPGEVLFTQEVYEGMQDISSYRAEARVLKLKGIEEPVKAYAVQV